MAFSRNIETITPNVLFRQKWVISCLLFLCFTIAKAQESPKVYGEADTTVIRIGEQIKYSIFVEADTTDQVIFPEGQTFSPLETVESFKTDTTRSGNRMMLQKMYALTQFDSGYYKLPIQRIDINGKGYFTDSLSISVNTVPVDTVNQAMYDIKPIMEVEKSYWDLWKFIAWVFIVLLLLAAVLYWFVFRKKPLSEEEKVALLPPYDRALIELKRLENSRYLIQDDYKKYYSELTDILRSYLEEDVHITALESTTGQLLLKIELLRDAGELKLDDQTLEQFRRILETADLVKFAKSKPDPSIAQKDRDIVEEIVVKTHEGIPEPTEEELQQQEEYREQQTRKKEQRKWYIAAASLVLFMVLGIVFAVSYYGFGYVKDSVFGHPSKTLLEGEWVSSSYGFPPVQLQSPEVLLRQQQKPDPEQKALIQQQQNFEFSLPDHWLVMGTISQTLNEQKPPEVQKDIDALLKKWTAKGARNLITKQEEFTTANGVKGVKIYGSGSFPEPGGDDSQRGQYAIYIFGGEGFQQQVYVSWLEDDPYAKDIVERVINSIEVKTQS
ncbi:hypothetical protein [Zeaxanthinibacter enoshimensis]|uniref:hypothetical protein n=1 Tax=Zeaxanthinibacter TaxID=561554 RepID=UPI003D364583